MTGTSCARRQLLVASSDVVRTITVNPVNQQTCRERTATDRGRSERRRAAQGDRPASMADYATQMEQMYGKPVSSTVQAAPGSAK